MILSRFIQILNSPCPTLSNLRREGDHNSPLNDLSKIDGIKATPSCLPLQGEVLDFDSTCMSRSELIVLVSTLLFILLPHLGGRTGGSQLLPARGLRSIREV